MIEDSAVTYWAPGEAPAGFIPSGPPAPTVSQLEVERDRRLSLGFNFDFKDSRGVHRFGTTPKDMAGWQEVSDWSLSQITTSSTDTLNIVTDTGPATITAMEWQLILKTATLFRQPIYTAHFTLKAQSPIPADYAADTHWPPVQ